MKMKVMALCCALMCMCTVFAGQKVPSASKVMKQAAKVLQKGGVAASFDIIQKVDGQEPYVIQGNVKMQEGCFMIFTPVSQTWYDGESQWSFLKENEEVTWTCPTKEELYDVNPYSYILDYDEAYRLGKSSLVAYRNQRAYLIPMKARDKDNMVKTVDVYVSPKTYEVLFVVLKEVSEGETQILVTDFKNGLKFDKSVFTYKDGQIPDVDLIDLR